MENQTGIKVIQTRTKIPEFVVHDLDRESRQVFNSLSDVPKNSRWYFEHIIHHGCVTITVGRTVYEVKYH